MEQIPLFCPTAESTTPELKQTTAVPYKPDEFSFSSSLWPSLWDTGKGCVEWVDTALCWQQGKHAGNGISPKITFKNKAFPQFLYIMLRIVIKHKGRGKVLG